MLFAGISKLSIKVVGWDEKKISSIQQIGVKYCRVGNKALFCWASFKDSRLKKDDRKEETVDC